MCSREEGHSVGIHALALMTGLTERTIRTHLAAGLLVGEKTEGQWRFSDEQVYAYLQHPAVRPSILAKNHAIVYDFLADSRKQERMLCTVYDIPSGLEREIAQFFCSRISRGTYQDIRFTFDGFGAVSRIILSGRPKDVLQLLADWEAEHPDTAAPADSEKLTQP